MPVHMSQNRERVPRHNRTDFAVQCANQGAPCPKACLVHVDVGICAVSADDRCVIDDRGGKVGMIVEGNRYRQVRRRFAKLAKKLAFAVVKPLRYHCAM